jgi:hypothetical protein
MCISTATFVAQWAYNLEPDLSDETIRTISRGRGEPKTLLRPIAQLLVKETSCGLTFPLSSALDALRNIETAFAPDGLIQPPALLPTSRFLQVFGWTEPHANEILHSLRSGSHQFELEDHQRRKELTLSGNALLSVHLQP